ncbi:MAG TPA: hypothetical protein VG826_35030 [Pirellulales bacterium]|nr:hypothetical protein [Pirellulales bacterium]
MHARYLYRNLSKVAPAAPAISHTTAGRTLASSLRQQLAILSGSLGPKKHIVKLAKKSKRKQKKAVAGGRDGVQQVTSEGKSTFIVDEELDRLRRAICNRVNRFPESNRHAAIAVLRELADECERCLKKFEAGNDGRQAAARS